MRRIRTTFHVRRKRGAKVPQLGEFVPELHRRAVHEDAQDCLRCAGIGDDLLGEKHAAGAVWLGWAWVLLWSPLEQEDEAVDGPVEGCTSTVVLIRHVLKLA